MSDSQRRCSRWHSCCVRAVKTRLSQTAQKHCGKSSAAAVTRKAWSWMISGTNWQRHPSSLAFSPYTRADTQRCTPTSVHPSRDGMNSYSRCVWSKMSTRIMYVQTRRDSDVCVKAGVLTTAWKTSAGALTRPDSPPVRAPTECAQCGRRFAKWHSWLPAVTS